MGVVERVDGFQRRHRVLGFPLAVIYKFFDDQGIYLAALLTYYGFLSLFPLLLLLASILGFALRDNEDLRQEILDSALSQFPVIREQLHTPQSLQGSGVAIVIGALVALYGALGVAQALQNAVNIAWAIPRHRRPNPIRARGRSLLLLATAGLAVLATTALSVLAGTTGADHGVLSGRTAILAAAAAIVVYAAIFGVAFRIATARPLRFAEIAPGAVLAALLWQAMQVFGTAYVAHVVKGQGAAYGVFAFVLGLLAWSFILAIGVVLCVEVNVVRSKRLYPRSLLTLFTDDVDLTAADRRTYGDAAVAQRFKGFEVVDVSFAHDGQNATARRRPEQGPEPEPAGEPVKSP